MYEGRRGRAHLRKNKDERRGGENRPGRSSEGKGRWREERHLVRWRRHGTRDGERGSPVGFHLAAVERVCKQAPVDE